MTETNLRGVIPVTAELCLLLSEPHTARYLTLAEYLTGRNDRLSVFNGICERLDPQGCVTDETRAHVTDPSSPFRRMVLRGAMIALALPLPTWLHENEEASAANAQWRTQYLANDRAAA